MASRPVVASVERVASIWDAAKSSFGFPTGIAIACGLIAGFGLPALDALLIVDVPVFEFDTQDAARGLLETVATVTVAVAGLAFSVTVVAFALASTQLSPRVLRSFRSDLLVRLTLATFIGTFIYCLAVMVRLGAVGSGGIPHLSITLAVLLSIVSFGLFAAFIAHIVVMLQPSSVIDAITEDAIGSIEDRYPGGVGKEPEDAEAVQGAVARLPEDVNPVLAEGQGYLTIVTGKVIVEHASRCDAIVCQRAPVGGYVLPGQPLADIHAADPAALADAVRATFVLGRQRTFVQDVAFGIRQLADIALKGVSPGINDPTTARNSIEALSGVLVRVARAEVPSSVRVDDEGLPRFVALVPTFDQLVRLGFEEVRGFSSEQPELLARLLELLQYLRGVAVENGCSHAEIDRQSALIARAGDVDVTLG